MNCTTRLFAGSVAVLLAFLFFVSPSDAAGPLGGAPRVAARHGFLPNQYGSRFVPPSPYPWGYYGYGLWYPPIDYHYYLDYYRIPYFAKHPPVYYSYPVARTYGYSPYAYPAGTGTPELPASEPLTIRNPYVPQRKTGPGQDQVTIRPLRQRNPYVAVAVEEPASEGKLAASEPRHP